MHPTRARPLFLLLAVCFSFIAPAPAATVTGTVVDAVLMEGWVRNGSAQPLSGLRWQNCVMLKAAAGFHEQTGQNKVLRAPYAACRSADGRRWIVTAWDPLDGVWQNPPVPCLHSNPKFPDCRPGETVRARGWLSFFEGEDLAAELDRIERTGWRAAKPVDAGSAAPRQ